jgi:ribonuclease D
MRRRMPMRRCCGSGCERWSAKSLPCLCAPTSTAQPFCRTICSVLAFAKVAAALLVAALATSRTAARPASDWAPRALSSVVWAYARPATAFLSDIVCRLSRYLPGRQHLCRWLSWYLPERQQLCRRLQAESVGSEAIVSRET